MNAASVQFAWAVTFIFKCETEKQDGVLQTKWSPSSSRYSLHIGQSFLLGVLKSVTSPPPAESASRRA